MKIKRFITDVFDYILSLFYPNRCKFCGELTDTFDEVCDNCEKDLPVINGEICLNCGSKKTDCECKGRHGHFYEGIVAPLYYVDKVRHCIHNYKFNDERLNYKCLADFMSKSCAEYYGNIKFDYVTYIPMRRKSLKWRGYNQSRLLAKRISENSGIPFGDNLLIKLYDTKVQRNCSELERKGNLAGVFDVSEKYDVNEKTVLLVDDVKTSGATLSECGKMLYLNGATAVYCLTAALVNSKIKKEN